MKKDSSLYVGYQGKAINLRGRPVRVCGLVGGLKFWNQICFEIREGNVHKIEATINVLIGIAVSAHFPPPHQEAKFFDSFPTIAPPPPPFPPRRPPLCAHSSDKFSHHQNFHVPRRSCDR